MKTLFVSLSAHAGTLVLDKYDGKNGCYVCVLPNDECKEELAKIAQQIGNENYDEIKEKVHTTVVYSTAALKEIPKYIEPSFEGVCVKVESMVGHDGDTYIYAAIDCPALVNLHKTFLRNGAKHSFDDYVCHVTLDKHKADEWEAKKAEVEALIAQVNQQLEERRLVITYDEIRIANLKD